MEADDPIDLLERRIAALELKVMPSQVSEENASQSAISHMLVHTNTLISSALSGREVVTAILNRMSEINQYLDPNFYEDRLNTAAKLQFLLAIYPEIKKYGESILKLKYLVSVLDSEYLNNVPNLVPKLEELTLNNIKAHEENQLVSLNISQALQQYNDIIYSINRTFIQLEEIVTHLETEIKRSLTSE